MPLIGIFLSFIESGLEIVELNGKAGNVGISGRNYPTGYELVNLINQSITKMLGNSIVE